MRISNCLSLGLCLVVLAAAAYSQSAKFDIVTYTAPSGWEVTKDADSIRFSKESGGNYCVISLTRAVDSMGESSKDFLLLWKAMAVDVLDVKTEPKMGTPGKKDGWDAEFGIAPFVKEGLKGAALLATFTGNGKVVAVLAITSSDAFENDIETFVNDTKLPVIAAKPPAAPVSKP
jgi:hypothetical protein